MAKLSEVTGEMETVVVRLLDVARARPELVDDSTADQEDGAYSADFLDGIAWAISALEKATAGSKDPRDVAIRDQRLPEYKKQLDAINGDVS